MMVATSAPQLASAETRIGEGAEPDARQMSRLAGGDVAKEVDDGSQRQVVGFNLVANHKPLDRGDEVEMPTNDAPDETRFIKSIEPAPGEGLALSHAEEQRQVAWSTEVRRLRVACLVNLAEFMNDLLGDTDAAKPADGNRIPGADQPDRLSRCYDLAGLALPGRWNDCRCAHWTPLLYRFCHLCGSHLTLNAA